MDPMVSKLVSLFGIAVFCGIAVLLSESRRDIVWRIALWGLLLQVGLAVLVLGVPAFGIPALLRPVFDLATDFFNALLGFTQQGSEFLFGEFVGDEYGYVFALQALPTIVFLSALIAVLYHLGIMQWLVRGLAWVMYRAMRISGAESLATSANVFVGQTEAPLMVRPFVPDMTRSELFTLMVGGMTTAAGSVLAVYVSLLQDAIPDIAGHLLTASVLSAPAAIMFAKLMVPEQGEPSTLTGLPEELDERPDTNVIESAARGAGEGLTLALNVGAMLLAFIALIAMIDAALGAIGNAVSFGSWGQSLVAPVLREEGQAVLSLSVILSWLFAPVALLMGIAPSEALVAGSLLGEKVAVNEFVAYSSLSNITDSLSERTILILSYALCGFANFASIAIQIGGIGGMAPKRRGELAALGIRAVIGGSLAAFVTACIANVFLG